MNRSTFTVSEKGLSSPGLELTTFQPKGQSVASGPRRHIAALRLDLSLVLRVLVRLVVSSLYLFIGFHGDLEAQ